MLDRMLVTEMRPEFRVLGPARSCCLLSRRCSLLSGCGGRRGVQAARRGGESGTAMAPPLSRALDARSSACAAALSWATPVVPRGLAERLAR